MSKTIELDIPASAKTRARHSVIRSILNELLSHRFTVDMTVKSIDDLLQVEFRELSDELHATGRTRVGNDIGGI